MMMNPLQMLFQNFGNNPMQMIQGIFSQNPNFANQMNGNDIYKNAMQMYKSGDMQNLEKLVRNVYQNRGMNINQMIGGINRYRR